MEIKIEETEVALKIIKSCKKELENQIYLMLKKFWLKILWKYLLKNSMDQFY